MQKAGKRLWMSEFGCGSSPPNGMKAALELSAVILQVPHLLLVCLSERCWGLQRHCARLCFAGFERAAGQRLDLLAGNRELREWQLVGPSAGAILART